MLLLTKSGKDPALRYIQNGTDPASTHSTETISSRAPYGTMNRKGSRPLALVSLAKPMGFQWEG